MPMPWSYSDFNAQQSDSLAWFMCWCETSSSLAQERKVYRSTESFSMMENQEQDEFREPTLEELGLHSHCLNCISKRCTVSVEPGVSCPHIYCPFKCGAYFHQCKADDHSELCPNVKTECLNSELGCQAMMRRALCIHHLQQCPAHVIMCGQSMARDDYENHFCDGHDHKCEPVLGEWRDQRRALIEAAEEEEAATGSAEVRTGEVGSKGKEKKEEDGGVGKKDETDSARKKGEDAKSSAIPKPRDTQPQDPLHTVPWQLMDRGIEGDVEQDGEDMDAPLSPAPLSPAPPPVSPSPDEPLNLGHLPYRILQEIGLHLDRQSLHELALTSHFFREVAASLLRKKGLVETRWKKVDNKWMEDGRIWRYIPAHLKPEPKESQS